MTRKRIMRQRPTREFFFFEVPYKGILVVCKRQSQSVIQSVLYNLAAYYTGVQDARVAKCRSTQIWNYGSGWCNGMLVANK